MIYVRGSFPTGPFKFRPKESHKGSPLIRFRILEDGAGSDAVATRISGVADIGQQVLDAVTPWKYKPRPVRCGILETEMSVSIPGTISR